MNMSIDGENGFAAFKDELKRRLAAREPRDIEESGLRRAAVMMLLMNREGAAHVLLTLRTTTVSSHKGQVSFPGGSVDPGDADHLEAALRETEEEVGIERGLVEYIGRFDDYISIAGYHVFCHVGAVDYPFPCTINEKEIESCFTAPLSLFVEEKYERVELYNYRGDDYRVFFYRHEGYDIWGLTARILTDFGRKICHSLPQGGTLSPGSLPLP